MTLHRFLLALGLLLFVSGPAAAGVSLGTGVVVDPEQRLAWIAAPEGRIAAVDLTDGQIRWNGPALGHPLARLDPGLLVALQPEAPGVWPLAWVDPQTGAVGERFEASLPADVLASLEPLPNQRFEVHVQAVEGGVALHWFSQRWPLRGAKLEDDEGVTLREGVIRVDAARSRAVASDTTPTRPRIDLDASVRIVGLDAIQLRSADDRHLMQRTPIADAQWGQRWVWQVHTRSNGSKLAEVTLPEAAAPWLVDGTRLLWVARPAVLVDAEGAALEQPARLVAVNLADADEVWSVALRDPVFRGSTPP